MVGDVDVRALLVNFFPANELYPNTSYRAYYRGPEEDAIYQVNPFSIPRKEHKNDAYDGTYERPDTDDDRLDNVDDCPKNFHISNDAVSTSPFLRARICMINRPEKYVAPLKSILLVFMVFTFLGATAQRTDNTERRNSVLAFPVAFYAPETRFGAGAFGAFNFYFNKADSISPPSQVQLGFAYTQNNQFAISVPFNLYWKNRLHTVTGEVSYNDFSYNFYGIGNQNTSGERELYKARFPRLRINYLRKILPHVFVGARWWYEDYRIRSFETNNNFHDDAPGKSGSTTSGPGIVALYDSRNNIYYTTRGIYLELVYHNQSALTGSNFFYDRYRFDLRHFRRFIKRTSLASNLFGDFISGSVPFSQMPGIGSGKRGRGFYEGRFRDRNILLYQGELRSSFFRRFGGVAFWNYALLADKIGHFSFSHDHASAGLGLRFIFDRTKNINLRFDAATQIGSGYYRKTGVASPYTFYFTVNEAF